MVNEYQVTDVRPGIRRIGLEMPDELPEPVSGATNVYLLDGETPALVNAGHPSQFETLAKAIRSTGVELSAIERILHTSWSVAVLGGAKNFPDVDHFVFSPDMTQPRNYRAVLEERRDELLDLADELLEHDKYADANRADVERFVERYFVPVPPQLDFVPVRRGHVVHAADFELEAIAAPGPTPGHTCLFEEDKSLLFTGDIALSGMPEAVDEVQSYFVTLERLIELEPDRLLPNSGDVSERGAWTLQCAHRFVNNFMSNAPQAMYQEPTLVEFAERDWGRQPEDFAETVLKIQVYQKLMDELVRSRMIEAEGEGLDRRYGTDVEDPRGEIRKL
jgi:glyoxylase-like metal-dependent hydrolase (beta-lactamase superfamily II)